MNSKRRFGFSISKFVRIFFFWGGGRSVPPSARLSLTCTVCHFKIIIFVEKKKNENYAVQFNVAAWIKILLSQIVLGGVLRSNVIM